MSYPKPLSEKSLKRLYTQTGLSTEAYDFLHSLFAACANLYGAIALRDVWSVYRELKRSAPYSPTGSRCFFRHRPPGGTALSGLRNRRTVHGGASQRSGSAHRIEGTDWHRLWQDVFLLCVDGRTRQSSVLCS